MSSSVNGSSRSHQLLPSAVDATQPSSFSGYAKYIGRVGALAVALGVGVAVVTGSGGGLGVGVAYAQTEGGADGGGQDAGAGEGDGEGAGEGAGEAPGDLNLSVEPGAEQAGEGDGEPGAVSGDANGAGVPEMNLNVGGGAEIKGQEEQGQDELGEGEGEGQGENQGEDGNEGEGLTPSGTGTPAAPTISNYVAPSGSGVPAPGAPIVPSKSGPSGITGSAGPNLIDPSASRLADGENSMSLFSLNTDPGQSLQLTTAAAPGTPAPAPLVHQPANPIEAVFGSVVAVVNIATTAVATFVSSILAPGPNTPAPPMMLFVVLGWAQRELQRTFLNQKPTAVVDSISTAEDTDVAIDVLANDIDPDINPGTDGNPYPGDRLTVTNYTQPANGSVELNADGTFTYTPDADFHGTDTFSYTVSDEASPWHLHGLAGFFGGGGHTSATTVTVTVDAVNDAPEAVDDTIPGTVGEDSTTGVTYDVVANDTDVDDETLNVSAVVNTAPTYGTVTFSGGTVTYTPSATDPLVQGLDDNETLTDTFSYTVSDGNGGSDTATVTVTITGANDAPEAVDDVIATTVSEDSTTGVTFNVVENDTDVDDDTLNVSAVVNTAPTYGTVTFSGGTVTYIPSATNPAVQGLDTGETLEDTFTYTVTDGDATDTATVTVTITGANDAPEAVDDVITTTVSEDSTTGVTFNVVENDTDVDDETLNVSAVVNTAPTYGTVTFSGGTVTYIPSATNPAVQGLDTGETLEDTFTYTVTDGDATDTATVTVTITGVDDNEEFDTTTLNLGGSPTDIVITPDGTRAYIANISGGTVTVLDIDPNSPTYHQVIDTNQTTGGVQNITVGQTPHTLAVSPDGKRLYVTHYTGGDRVTVVDIDPNSATYNQVIDTNQTTGGVQDIAVGGDPTGIAISPDGTRAYVANSDDASVSVIDVDPNSPTYHQVIDADPTDVDLDAISVPDGPFKVTVSPDGTRIYVSNITDSSVTAIDIDPDSPTYHQVIDTNQTTSGVQSIPVGSVPQGIAVTPDGSRAYVVNTNLDTVTVIDTDPDSPTYHQVIDTNQTTGGVQNITVGNAPTRISISPDGKRAYVTNLSGDDVSVIDIDPDSPTYNTVIDTNPATVSLDNVPVGDSPDGIAITPDGTRAYVTSNSTGTITVINLGDGQVDPEFDLYNVGNGPIDSVVVGNRLYTTSYGNGGGSTVTVVDLDTNTQIGAITVGAGPALLTVVGDQLYVANNSGNAVSVIDLNTNTVVQTIPVSSRPAYMTVVGDQLYVASEVGQVVTVIDTSSNTVIDTIPTGGATPFAITRDGDRVYVAHFNDDSVAIIDTTTNTLIDTDPDVAGTQNISVVGLSGPRGIAVVGSSLYLANNNGTVSVVDLTEYSAVDIDPNTNGTQPIVIPGGGALTDMVVKGDILYVGDQSGNEVYVIDTTTNTVIDTITVGNGPWGLHIDGDYLYVTNSGDGTVSAIDIGPSIV